MEISEQIVTYQDVINGIKIEKDDYGLAQHLLRQGMRDTFLENPFLEDNSHCYMCLYRVDGVVAGRLALFPLQLVMTGACVKAQSASTLAVEERFRTLAIGTDLILFPYMNSAYDIFIYAGISKMALPIYKKMKFQDLSTPIMILPKKSVFFLSKIGTPTFLQRCMAPIADFFLNLYLAIRRIGWAKPKNYYIEEINDIPSWIEDIVNKDSHRYKENHDNKWFKWVLEHLFVKNGEKAHHLYAIYDKERLPKGFFMTKEIFYKRKSIVSGGLHVGSIIEWGSYDETLLSESDIYKLAIPFFSKQTDFIEITSSNKDTIRKVKRMGFFFHGDNHIIVKERKETYHNIGDISNWRIRLGYADVPFY